MTVGEAIQRVQSLFSVGVESEDTRLRPRHIYSILKTARARVLREAIGRGYSLAEDSFQTIACMPLIEASPIECPCLPNLSCPVLRTEDKLPERIETRSFSGIRIVSSLDFKVIFSKIQYNMLPHVDKLSRFNRKKYYYYILNDYIYIVTDTGIRYIAVSGLFYDPYEAYRIQCGNECVSPYDVEFEANAALIDNILRLAYDEVLRLMNVNREDRTADSSEDSPSEFGSPTQGQQQ
ncbi:MAG: hypothetical protein KatS3mg083_530 [Candidatus Dojkabacteria bacterium]|nr:MAG: hypothetical protein KatS3mg083_530 [Candidatus Dojkabacteria bacterium]